MPQQKKNAREQRRENAYQVINLIRQEPKGLARTQITEEMGLSFPASTKIVNYLLEFNLIEERSGVGQNNKSIPFYHFNGKRFITLGLAMMRKNIIGVVCNLNGEILHLFELQSEGDLSAELMNVASRFLSFIEPLREQEYSILGLGIGVPGLIDSQKGRVRYATDFHEIEKIDLVHLMGRELGIPVYSEQNSNVAAFAEKSLGSTRTLSEFLYLNLSSGVGASLFHNNRLYRGENVFLGELGHTTVNPDGEICDCGSRGCLETIIGWQHLSDRLKNSPEAENEILEEAAVILARSLSPIVCLLGLKNIVLGGSLVKNLPEFPNRLEKQLAKIILPNQRPGVNVHLSPLDNTAAATGAALYLGEIALFNLNGPFFGRNETGIPIRMDGVF